MWYGVSGVAAFSAVFAADNWDGGGKNQGKGLVKQIAYSLLRF